MSLRDREAARAGKDARLRLAEVIREYAARRGWALERVGAELGVSRRTLFNYAGWEPKPDGLPPIAAQLPSAEHLRLVCKLTDVSADWVLFGTEPRYRGQYRAAAALESDIATAVMREAGVRSNVAADIMVDGNAVVLTAAAAVAVGAKAWRRWMTDATLALLGFGYGGLEAHILHLTARKAGARASKRRHGDLIAPLIRQAIDDLLRHFKPGGSMGMPDTGPIRLVRMRPLVGSGSRTPYPEFFIDIPPTRQDVAKIVRFALWQLGRRFINSGVDPETWLPPADELERGLPGVSWRDARQIVLERESPFDVFCSRWLSGRLTPSS